MVEFCKGIQCIRLRCKRWQQCKGLSQRFPKGKMAIWDICLCLFISMFAFHIHVVQEHSPKICNKIKRWPHEPPVTKRIFLCVWTNHHNQQKYGIDCQRHHVFEMILARYKYVSLTDTEEQSTNWRLIKYTSTFESQHASCKCFFLKAQKCIRRNANVLVFKLTTKSHFLCDR